MKHILESSTSSDIEIIDRETRPMKRSRSCEQEASHVLLSLALHGASRLTDENPKHFPTDSLRAPTLVSDTDDSDSSIDHHINGKEQMRCAPPAPCVLVAYRPRGSSGLTLNKDCSNLRFRPLGPPPRLPQLSIGSTISSASC